MAYIFTPPPVKYPVGVDPLWSRFHFQVGQAVLKKDGFYTAAEVVTDEDFAGADIGYLGGHTYLVTDAEAADLQAAGYSEWLRLYVPGTVPPSTIDPPEYGRGAYGTGTYGR